LRKVPGEQQIVADAPIEQATVASGVKISIYRVPRADGSDIQVYFLGCTELPTSRPCIMLLHGSGCDSVFRKTDTGATVPLLFDPLCGICDEWDVFFVEKRGVHFGQCSPPDAACPASTEYLKGASYEERVSDACRVMDRIVSGRGETDAPIIVIGSSEGSDVAVGLAARHVGPTHVALLPPSAAHGLFDSLVGLRDELGRGLITAEQFREQYEWLVSTFREIFASPGSIDRSFWGHSYLRWSSFCSGSVLKDLISIRVPVFLGIPSLDHCEGADLAVGELVKHGKTNFAVHHYVNYDHGFFEHIAGRTECRHEVVLADILKWAGNSNT
jgi:pimeloyl-ACP methyl ester carboxylesterase